MLFLRHSPVPSGVPPSPAADNQSDASGSRVGTQGRAWALKSFATGVSVLGLAYCLVQVAGVQYLATLTSVSLLAFLLVYLVWCATSRRRHQLTGGVDCEVPSSGYAEHPIVITSNDANRTIPPPNRHTHLHHHHIHHALPSCSSAVELHDAELLRSLAAAGVFVGPSEWKPSRAVTPPPSYEEAVRNIPPPLQNNQSQAATTQQQPPQSAPPTSSEQQ